MMAVYMCNKCGQWMDDDYHPCSQDVRTPSGLDLVCPDCEAEIQEDIDAAHARLMGDGKRGMWG